MNDSSYNSPKAKQLRQEHNPLREHWSARFSSTMDLNHDSSDNTYKHHVASLMSIYTAAEQKLTNFKIKTKAHVMPMTQLYGVKGMRSSAPEMDILKDKRVERWDNRINLTENIHSEVYKKERQDRLAEERIRNKLSSSSGAEVDGNGYGERGRSTSSSNRYRQPTSRSRSPQVHGGTVGEYAADSELPQHNNDIANSQFGSSRNRHANDGIGPGASASGLDVGSSSVAYNDENLPEDLVLQGLYRFENDAEIEIYNKFVLLLTNYDSHDMLLILQDAMKDAQAATMLDAYGGTQLPSRVAKQTQHSSTHHQNHHHGGQQHPESQHHPGFHRQHPYLREHPGDGQHQSKQGRRRHPND